ncbi:MAG TPA: helix-turn-helix domain-containing protein [Acidimicrobiia bacterium]|nr:helix-turn-helix domain-containing protein [Acidimicrobiia bacterium]
MASRTLPDVTLAKVLAVPMRRKVFELLDRSDDALSIAELTDALGCNHNTVRQHLAKLRVAGLVEEHVEDRLDPGRPRLLYTAVRRPDPYQRLARLLLEVATSRATPRAVGRRVGREEAQRRPSADPIDALEAEAAMQGFVPRRADRGRTVDLVLEECPLADVAARDPRVICALHRGLAEGLLDVAGGARITGFIARDPYDAGCRIRVERKD